MPRGGWLRSIATHCDCPPAQGRRLSYDSTRLHHRLLMSLFPVDSHALKGPTDHFRDRPSPAADPSRSQCLPTPIWDSPTGVDSLRARNGVPAPSERWSRPLDRLQPTIPQRLSYKEYPAHWRKGNVEVASAVGPLAPCWQRIAGP